MDTTYACALVQELNRQRHLSSQGLSDTRMTLCDVTLTCGGHTYPAHRSVLAATCDFFRAKYTGSFSDNMATQHALPEVEKQESVLELLDYLYTGVISLTAENVEDVVLLADYLCIKVLKDKCGTFLLEHLSIENCIQVKVLVDRYALTNIYSSLLLFMAPQFKHLIQNDDILRLSGHDLGQILQDLHFNHIREVDLFYLVDRWLRYDFSSRHPFLLDITSHLEPAYLTKGMLLDMIATCPNLIEVLKEDPAKNNDIQMILQQEDLPRADTYILCRSRSMQISEKVELLLYSVTEDSWSSLPPHPALECGWNGLDTMAVHNGCLYILSTESEDICGYVHQANLRRSLLTLDPVTGQFSCNPGPSTIQGSSRLVSLITGLFIMDGYGAVELFITSSNTWQIISAPCFLGRPLYFLPMPYNNHLYVFRALSSAQSLDFPETDYSLNDLDVQTGIWTLVSDISSHDLDLNVTERFHGYTITPTTILMNNELGHHRLKYDLVTESWTKCALPNSLPKFIGEVWGSTACRDRTYFVARMAKNNKTSMMMYDHQRKRFKGLKEPEVALSGVLCNIHVDKSIFDRIVFQ